MLLIEPLSPIIVAEVAGLLAFAVRVLAIVFGVQFAVSENLALMLTS